MSYDDMLAGLDLVRLRELMTAATPPPWRVAGDRIIQTQHITRDVWTIPHGDGDLPLIVAVVNALPAMLAIIEAARALEIRGEPKMGGGEHAGTLRVSHQSDALGRLRAALKAVS